MFTSKLIVPLITSISIIILFTDYTSFRPREAVKSLQDIRIPLLTNVFYDGNYSGLRQVENLHKRAVLLYIVLLNSSLMTSIPVSQCS